MKVKTLNVKEVRALAQRLYCFGGSAIVECWTDEEIQAAIDDGCIDVFDWLKEIAIYRCWQEDMNLE